VGEGDGNSGSAPTAAGDEAAAVVDAVNTEAVVASVEPVSVVFLYKRFRPQIYRYCLSQLGNHEDAEDATQLTFLNAFRGLSRGSYRDVGPPWLFTVAQNVCLNSRRASARRRRVEIPSELEESLAPPREAGSRDEVIRLPEALRRLPPLQRRAILLREWRGLSYREIGDELDLSQAATEAILFRARRSLAGFLSTEP
jgi:RNA polymerase sigma-70 factor (ECF subfamily)